MTSLLIKIFIKNGDVKDAEVRRKYGYLGSFTGIALNILLFIGKIIAGIIAGAVSVIADAFNNLSDAGSSILTLVGFKFAGRPADKEHPFGHGRMEYVTGLIVSFVIMMMGFELLKSSVGKILSPEDIKFSPLALGILIASVLVKLWMSLFNRKLGKIINSTALKATATDSLTDSVATTVVIISMLVSKFTGFDADGYAGVLVSLFIFYAGINTFKDSLTPLLGSRPDKEFVNEVYERVMSYPEIVGVHDLMVHDYGVGNLVISLHAEVPCQMDFEKAHELIDIIEDDLKTQYTCLATIHMDPVASHDEETQNAKAMVQKVVAEIDTSLTIHDFRMTKGTTHINLLFDVVVPYGFRYSDDKTVEMIRNKLHEIDEKYFAVIVVDKDMTM
ncbi:MAG: cation transporter [Oscillospiraceae bacterium]|nr:cation transporter [Oscillospiraceae bacterium]